jgi:uncharacterized membrane protein
MTEHTSVATHGERTPDVKQRADAEHRVNVGESERWVSLVGGGMLALYGRRRSLPGLALVIGGGALLYRGMSGHCAVYNAIGIDTAGSRLDSWVTVEAVVIVNKPIADVYRFYRTLENHPRFVTYLESVTSRDQTHSHWVAKTPLHTQIEWDAEIVEERENARLAWRSLPGADLSHHGSARFHELPNDRGTEVQVNLEYAPPGGAVGKAVAQLLNTISTQQLQEELRHFKQLLEAGEQPTIAG